MYGYKYTIDSGCVVPFFRDYRVLRSRISLRVIRPTPSAGVLPIIEEIVAAEKAAEKIVTQARTDSERRKNEQADRHRTELSEATEAARELARSRIEEARSELEQKDSTGDADVVLDPRQIEATIGDIVELILKTWIEV